MANTKSNNNFVIIGLLIALANLAVFGAMFTLMGYFELMGADKSYFDEGSLNNISIMNKVLGLFGLNIDPLSTQKISTLKYALCYGVALLSTGLSIFIATRKAKTEYEVSDAV